jgi:phage gp36-like protein
MAYITHVDLAESPGALELSEVASDEHRAPVRAELLDALLRGGDTSAWPAADVLAAQGAVQRIDAAAADAQAMIDGYLAKRGYALPLAPVPSLVVAWCRAIARYMLHKNRRSMEATDRIARSYTDAQRLLQQTADGKFSLGALDAVATDTLDARFECAPSVFGRSQLGAFR